MNEAVCAGKRDGRAARLFPRNSGAELLLATLLDKARSAEQTHRIGPRRHHLGVNRKNRARRGEHPSSIKIKSVWMFCMGSIGELE